MNTASAAAGAKVSAWSYVAPFASYLVLLAAGPHLPLGPGIQHFIRLVVVTSVLLIWSRNLLNFKVSRWGASVVLGLVVFVIWIGPDLVWPGYRTHWLLTNVLTGAASSSIPPATRHSAGFLVWRVGCSALLVPIVEELFWRAWLMRYLISRSFWQVALGAYAPRAFWITAALFASEHGPYWDVGLAAGILSNWWMVRTRNVADCILAHAVTNACLSGWLMYSGKWEYWL